MKYNFKAYAFVRFTVRKASFFVCLRAKSSAPEQQPDPFIERYPSAVDVQSTKERTLSRIVRVVPVD